MKEISDGILKKVPDKTPGENPGDIAGENIAAHLIHRMRARGMTVTAVESCTGGMVAAALTSVPGSSEVFHRGFITYCDEAKHEMVGVRSETLNAYTAVSPETAREMAEGGARMAKADCSVSVTGYAGPDSGSGEPVGLVYVGCCVCGASEVREFHFSGNRREIRCQAARAALDFLRERLDTEQMETVN